MKGYFTIAGAVMLGGQVNGFSQYY